MCVKYQEERNWWKLHVFSNYTILTTRWKAVNEWPKKISVNVIDTKNSSCSA